MLKIHFLHLFNYWTQNVISNVILLLDKLLVFCCIKIVFILCNTLYVFPSKSILLEGPQKVFNFDMGNLQENR